LAYKIRNTYENMVESKILFYLEEPTGGENCTGRIYYNPTTDRYIPIPYFGYYGKCILTKEGVDTETGDILYASCENGNKPAQCPCKEKKSPLGITSFG
jgi:hypothetical protein